MHGASSLYLPQKYMFNEYSSWNVMEVATLWFYCYDGVPVVDIFGPSKASRKTNSSGCGQSYLDVIQVYAVWSA